MGVDPRVNTRRWGLTQGGQYTAGAPLDGVAAPSLQLLRPLSGGAAPHWSHPPTCSHQQKPSPQKPSPQKPSPHATQCLTGSCAQHAEPPTTPCGAHVVEDHDIQVGIVAAVMGIRAPQHSLVMVAGALLLKAGHELRHALRPRLDALQRRAHQHGMLLNGRGSCRVKRQSWQHRVNAQQGVHEQGWLNV